MIFCLLGRKFSSKCKHSVKCIRCRMETIRKKKQAIVRYLKKDVADLISGGHDTIAFGRMDALIVEINQSSCYDMIEKYCCCILEHLPAMQKDRVCPEETVEAIATMIFAAARFPDLPELAELRNQFTKRYGTFMEAYINEEFVEKMKKKSFPQDDKLRLMRDIAREFSIHWDFNEFEYRISNPSSPTLDQPKIKFLSSNENSKQLKSEEHINGENINDRQKIVQMRKYEHPTAPTEKITEVGANDFKTESPSTCERFDGAHGLFSSSIGIEKRSADSAKSVNSIPPYTKIARDFHNGISEAVSVRTFNLKPPYVKPKITTKSSSMESRSSEPANHEIPTNGINHVMNPIRRAASKGDFAVKAADSFGQMPIKQAGSLGRKKNMYGVGDGDDWQSFVSLSFERAEEDATNGSVNVRRHLQRAFSDRTRHGGWLS
ncbi:uncharacterized protein LOC110030583 [Phalaenopsis equestris]|uniref:uncharacterized protein LOC110030583 n=1 Tax=Phalaenopsis equestris TaxID=78828 RepID=UPI0009E2DD5C|nr:uncharacterized protein LOC110030583 [Phalaenopsis equestris]